MNLFWIYLGIGTMAVITVSGVIFFLYSRYREQEEPEDAPLLENYKPMYAEGHTDGVIHEIQMSEKRVKITFFPRDIKYIREIKKNKGFKIKPYVVFYDKSQVESFPEGDFSTHRAKVKAYPSRTDYLPQSIKKRNPEILWKIEKNNKLTDESELLRSRLRHLRKVASKTHGGEIFSDYVEKSQELTKDIVDSIKKEEKKYATDLLPQRK